MKKPTEIGEPRPTGLRLTPQTNRRLKALAAMYGVSKQEYLERLIERETVTEKLPARLVQAQTA